MSSGPASIDALLGDARWLRALARRLVSDEAAADDLAQDAWVAALERPPEAETARGWLASALENLARMRWRSERARSRRERASVRGESVEPAAEVVARAEAQRHLVEQVLALDEPYRSTILWRYFDGLSSAEIARRAGVPDSTVRTRLARGLAALRGRLEGERGRAWALALAPLARATSRSGTAAGIGLGVGVLAMKTVAAIGVVLVLLVALWTWSQRTSEEPTTALEAAALESARFDGDEPVVSEPPLAQQTAREVVDGEAAAPRALAEDEIAGRVITSAGEPVAGARVRVVLPRARQWPRLFFDDVAESERPVAEGRTDAQGEFSLRVDGERLLDLYASAEGFAQRKRAGLYAGERVELVLARAASLVGRVTRASDGAPVEGAWVAMQPGVLGLPGRVELRATTDARGEYRFEGLVPGWYEGRVGSAHEVATWLRRLLGEGEDARADVVLESGAALTGRVTDGRDESPLAGVRIWTWGDQEKVVLTDEHGEYRLEGIEIGSRPGVHASRAGFGTFAATVRYIGAGGARQDFFLMPGRTVRGRIVDASGNPIAGASVAAGSLSPPSSPSDGMDARSTTTGADGRFELTDLRIDMRHSLLVRAEGHACAVFDFPAREFEEMEIELGELTLEPPTLVRGRLTDLAGHPLAGLYVFADIEPLTRDRLGPVDGGDGYLSRGGLGTGELQAPTDAEGRFVFTDLPAGHWILKGDAKGYVHAAQVELDLAPGEKRTGVELAMDVGLSISGFVTDEEGRPLPGSVVDVYPEGSTRTVIYDLARDDGSFCVHGLDPGRYRVCADEGFGASGRAWSEASCAAGDRDVRIQLGRAVYVRVHVVDRTGMSLPGAYVGIQIGPDGYSMQASDEEGRTSVRVPEHGSFDLTASANPTFDPGSEFFRSFFEDENGKPIEGMSVEATGLVATSDEIVLTIPGLP